MSRSQIEDQLVTLLESASLAAHYQEDLSIGSDADCQAIVHRGMTVQTGEGHTVGHIAAVVLSQNQQKVTHILLLQERQRLEYRLIPVEAIKQVSDEKILLRIFQPAVDNLALWHSS